MLMKHLGAQNNVTDGEDLGSNQGNRTTADSSTKISSQLNNTDSRLRFSLGSNSQRENAGLRQIGHKNDDYQDQFR